MANKAEKFKAYQCSAANAQPDLTMISADRITSPTRQGVTELAELAVPHTGVISESKKSMYVRFRWRCNAPSTAPPPMLYNAVSRKHGAVVRPFKKPRSEVSIATSGPPALFAVCVVIASQTVVS
jgi:hypothetical protein